MGQSDTNRAEIAVPVGFATAGAALAAVSSWRFMQGRERRRQANARKAVVSKLPFMIAVLDGDLNIVNASRIFTDKLDPLGTEPTGDPIASFLEIAGDHDLPAVFARLAEKGDAMHVIGLPSGSDPIPLSLRVVDSDSPDRGWIVLLEDVGRQEKLDRLKSDFVSIVSHELRTPLSSIAGALGLVSAGATGTVNDDTSELVDIALNNTRRLIRLINDLLDIDKIEMGRLHFTMARHSLKELTQTAVEEIGPYAADHEVKITFTAQNGDDSVVVDADRLTQVLTNLLSNAIKFSPRGDTVLISIRSEPPYHRVVVADSGPGVPDTLRNKIFDKFVQGEAIGTRRTGGTGLGLTISRQIMDRLGGKLWLCNSSKRGATFCVDIPAASGLTG